MSQLPSPDVRAERRDSRRHGVPSGRGGNARGGIRSRHLWIAVLPASAMAVLGAVTVAWLAAADPSSGATRVVLAVAAVLAVAVLAAAVRSAGSATGWVQRRLNALRSSVASGQADVQRLVEQIRKGERPSPRGPEAPPVAGNDAFALLAQDLSRAQNNVQAALTHAAARRPGGGSGQRVEVFVNIARRLQSLVHREIQLLDELENQVEDPDLLKGLFFVDHLATRVRRQAESLAVLGGAVSRRQWSRPVTLTEVLRSAIAEVEQYSRVKLVPPVEGTVRGHAVADVIHLIAELVENATMFSPPHTQVLLRAQAVTAGLAIEVEDRGLGMPINDQHRMNSLLADPDQINIGELLRDGRIGLLVVAALARRHGVAVRLQSNIYGGIQAVVLLPPAILGAAENDTESQVQQVQQTPQAQVQVQQVQQAQQNRQVAPPAQQPALAGQSMATLSAAPQGGTSNGAYQPPADSRRPAADHGHNGSHSGGHNAGRNGSHNGSHNGERREQNGREPAPLPVRESANRSEPRQAARPAAQSGGGQPPARPTSHDPRPQLPQRRQQTHLAPQLRDSPAPQREETFVGHDPGLMAAFQRGVNLADEDFDPSPGRDDSAN
jgi:Histidine kinase-, DNA gyrase B-, and HSP90-like ATPase